MMRPAAVASFVPLTRAVSSSTSASSTTGATAMAGAPGFQPLKEETKKFYFRILYSPQPYHRKRKCFQEGLLVAMCTWNDGEKGIIPEGDLAIKKTELRNDRGDLVRHFRGFQDRRHIVELREGSELGYHSGMFLEIGEEIAEEAYLSGQMFLSSAAGNGNRIGGSTSSISGAARGVSASSSLRKPPLLNLKRDASSAGVVSSPVSDPVVAVVATEQGQSISDQAPRRVLVPLKKRRLLGAAAAMKNATTTVSSNSHASETSSVPSGSSSTAPVRSASSDTGGSVAVPEEERTNSHTSNITGSSAEVLQGTTSTEIRFSPDISVERALASKLRPHQVEALHFLYDALLVKNFSGALLADDMGLGKSLSTLAFLYTLLEHKIFKKCCIVCPASLCGNWKNEIKKWLGENKLRPTCIIGNSHAKTLKSQTVAEKMKFVMRAFAHGRTASDKLLILSYEQLRNHAAELSACLDFLILDEGHRLGHGSSQTTKTLGEQFRNAKKLLLSGTPLQNNLDEFFTLCEFLNPGSLGDFDTVFRRPILKGREPSATAQQRALGVARFQHLNSLARQFLLRRTANAVLRKILPPMHTVVVFCPLLDENFRKMYQQKLDGGTSTASVTSGLVQHEEQAPTSVLGLILELRRVCYESKMVFLKQFLRNLAQQNMKCVLVSNFTRCLDLLEGVLAELTCAEGGRKRGSKFGGGMISYSYERLDGSTNQKARTEMVDRFNAGVLASTASKNSKDTAASPKKATDEDSDFEGSNNDYNERKNTNCTTASSGGAQFFLLSSKAGGVGLNLIGASKLVMIDPDWNPAADAQAMRRVWRDGQEKEVFCYRLVVPGSVEECIFARQEKKTDLLHNVLQKDILQKQNNLTLAEVRQLFQLRGYPASKSVVASSVSRLLASSSTFFSSSSTTGQDAEMPAERGTASKGAPSTMKRLPAAARLLATSSTSLSTQIVEPTENQSNASSSSTFTNEPSGWRPSGYVQQMRSHSALSNELLEKSSLATSLSRGFVAVLGSQLADEDETS